jgi:hypothetical protein
VAASTRLLEQILSEAKVSYDEFVWQLENLAVWGRMTHWRRSSRVVGLKLTHYQLERYHRVIHDLTRVCQQAAHGDLEPRVAPVQGGGDLDDIRRAVNHLLAAVRADQKLFRPAAGARTSTRRPPVPGSWPKASRK